MRASDVAAFGKMNTFGDGPSLGVRVCLEVEFEVGASADSVAAGFVDLVRGIAVICDKQVRPVFGSEDVGFLQKSLIIYQYGSTKVKSKKSCALIFREAMN